MDWTLHDEGGAAADAELGEGPDAEPGVGPEVEVEERPDSRERLLAAAVELILEHHSTQLGLRKVFSYLTPGAVAERAGLSRGLIYHYWGDPTTDGSAAFSRFLGAVAGALWVDGASQRELTEVLEELPANPSDIITVLSAIEYARLAGPDNARARASLSLKLYGTIPEEQPGHFFERLVSLYELMMAKLRREPVPPLQIDDIVFAVIALSDGLAVNFPSRSERVTKEYDWQPAVQPSADAAPWTLFAIVAESIMLNMTRPVEAAP